MIRYNRTRTLRRHNFHRGCLACRTWRTGEHVHVRRITH